MSVLDKKDIKKHTNTSYGSYTSKQNSEAVVARAAYASYPNPIHGSLYTKSGLQFEDYLAKAMLASIPSVNFRVAQERSEISFLKRLINLPDDWTNGNPQKPLRQTITKAIEFIEIFDSKFQDSFSENNIKIIPGPLVTGGTCLDFIKDKVNSLTVSINNNNTVDFEACVNGEYLDSLNVPVSSTFIWDIFNDSLARLLF
ncbi:hypothetical protein [Leptospira meyeri]|uniref:hypothetical protein n=1 Tax=Leptospira meyeri TaxID=29508 RepID=UPI001083DE1E|nr:hypothetical protein [Leptospira meyeri]TGM22015.1 hypothetical protein EHQ73_09475 [Leptospira meyeri]